MNQKEAAKIIGDLFDQWVDKSLNRQFDPSRIEVDTKEGRYVYIYGWYGPPSTPDLRLEYFADGVHIEYHSRVTSHLGDTDCFVDYLVSVDGKVVVNRTFE